MTGLDAFWIPPFERKKKLCSFSFCGFFHDQRIIKISFHLLLLLPTLALFFTWLTHVSEIVPFLGLLRLLWFFFLLKFGVFPTLLSWAILVRPRFLPFSQFFSFLLRSSQNKKDGAAVYGCVIEA